ncbi:hypothetical protein [Methylosinus sp. LW4]|uniref:hypothetical protein n=1 Tax=Methylosinus sp. LW4 TaxID=136993 RepID=UPI00036DAD10|nr:hypothetical protein [Methylosinus sp. LW4]
MRSERIFTLAARVAIGACLDDEEEVAGGASLCVVASLPSSVDEMSIGPDSEAASSDTASASTVDERASPIVTAVATELFDEANLEEVHCGVEAGVAVGDTPR